MFRGLPFVIMHSSSLILSAMCLCSMGKICSAMISKIPKRTALCAYLGNDGTQYNAIQIGEKECCMCGISTYWAEDCRSDDPTSTVCKTCPCSENNCSYVDFEPHDRKKCFPQEECRLPFIAVDRSPSRKSRCVCPENTIEEEGHCAFKPDLVPPITTTIPTVIKSTFPPKAIERTAATHTTQSSPQSATTSTTNVLWGTTVSTVKEKDFPIQENSDSSDRSVPGTKHRYNDDTLPQHVTGKGGLNGDSGLSPSMITLIVIALLLMIIIAMGLVYGASNGQIPCCKWKVLENKSSASSSTDNSNTTINLDSGQQPEERSLLEERPVNVSDGVDVDNNAQLSIEQDSLLCNRDESNCIENEAGSLNVAIIPSRNGQVNRESPVTYRNNSCENNPSSPIQTINSSQQQSARTEDQAGQVQEHNVDTIPPDGDHVRVSKNVKEKVTETFTMFTDVITNSDTLKLARKYNLPPAFIEDLQTLWRGDTPQFASKIFERIHQLKPQLTLQDIKKKVEGLGYLMEIVDDKIIELQAMETEAQQ